MNHGTATLLAASLIGLLAPVAAFASTAPAGSLVGDRITAVVDVGSTRTAGLGSFVVEAGMADTQNYEGIFTLNVNADGFTIVFQKTGHFAAGTTLDLSGLDFSNGATLGNFIIATTVQGAKAFTASPTSVGIDFGNTDYRAGYFILGAFTTVAAATPSTTAAALEAGPILSPVPEPASAALLAAGIAGLALARRRRGRGR